MSEKYILNPGDRITVSGERIEVEETTLVSGNLIPKKEYGQKTYMLKAHCPKCNRIIRVTDKNWKHTDVRLSISCVHTNNEAFDFILDNPEEVV